MTIPYEVCADERISCLSKTCDSCVIHPHLDAYATLEKMEGPCDSLFSGGPVLDADGELELATQHRWRHDCSVVRPSEIQMGINGVMTERCVCLFAGNRKEIRLRCATCCGIARQWELDRTRGWRHIWAGRGEAQWSVGNRLRQELG